MTPYFTFILRFSSILKSTEGGYHWTRLLKRRRQPSLELRDISFYEAKMEWLFFPYLWRSQPRHSRAIVVPMFISPFVIPAKAGI